MKLESVEEIKNMVACKYYKASNQPYKDWDDMISHLFSKGTDMAKNAISERYNQVIAMVAYKIVQLQAVELKNHPNMQDDNSQRMLQSKIDEAAFRRMKMMEQQ